MATSGEQPAAQRPGMEPYVPEKYAFEPPREQTPGLPPDGTTPAARPGPPGSRRHLPVRRRTPGRTAARRAAGQTWPPRPGAPAGAPPATPPGASHAGRRPPGPAAQPRRR